MYLQKKMSELLEKWVWETTHLTHHYLAAKWVSVWHHNQLPWTPPLISLEIMNNLPLTALIILSTPKSDMSTPFVICISDIHKHMVLASAEFNVLHMPQNILSHISFSFQDRLKHGLIKNWNNFYPSGFKSHIR